MILLFIDAVRNQKGRPTKFWGLCVCLWGGCLNVPVEDDGTCENQIDHRETAAGLGFVGTYINALELYA